MNSTVSEAISSRVRQPPRVPQVRVLSAETAVMEFDRLAGDIVAEARHALKFLDLVAPCSIIRIGRKDRDGALLGSGKLSMSLEQFIGEPFVPGSGTDGKGRRGHALERQLPCSLLDAAR